MIIAFVGPSGIGKTYTVHRLLEIFPKARGIVWTTTRPFRIEETTRVKNRRFITMDAFVRREQEQSVLLAHDVHGHRYGILLEDQPLDGSVYLTELHITNIDVADKLGKRIVMIGLVPSSIDFLRTRLVDYRETTDHEEVRQRLESAHNEIATIECSSDFFHRILIVSPQTERMIVTEVTAIVRSILDQLGD